MIQAARLRHRQRRLKAGSWLVSLCLLGTSVPAFAAAPAEVGLGQTLGDATMRGLNGPARRLSTFRGKPLVINVWASWCEPCRQEMASLERLAWRDGGRHFTVIGISTDDYEDRAAAWLNRSNATINHYIDGQLQLETMLGAKRLPLTVLVDAGGRVVDKVYGAQEWDSAESLKRIGRAFKIEGSAPR